MNDVQSERMSSTPYSEPPAISPAELQELTDRLLPTPLPSGPLDRYRRNASFNWRHMKLFIEDPRAVKFENMLWKFLLNDPLFVRPIEEPTLDETRRLTFLRLKQLHSFFTKNGLSSTQFALEPYCFSVLSRCLGMFDWSIYIKYALSNVSFDFTLMTSTQPYHQSIYERIAAEELVGCLAITELGHGSNLKKMETRADYDPKTQEFVLNTPSLEATKCWVGNLGIHATHGIVYAQLYTADGTCHGICSFVVPLRDSSTRLPFTGIIVGDMGHKLGLNGIDNGFVQFRRYRVPRESLLNRFCDITPEGKFVSQVKDSNSRFGAALANLSAGRCAIIRMATINLAKGLAIAVRYSAARRQFGPPSEEEIPVWEYQLQRWRLLPYLSASYVLDLYGKYICEVFREFSIQSFVGSKTLTDKKVLSVEIHCLTCAIKPLSGWVVRDALQECREACGGHGFLKIAGIGDIRNEHDANLTYEGDNNVLQQQTGQFLMLQLAKKRSGKTIESLLHTFDFINNLDQILRGGRTLRATRMEDLLDMEVVLSAYKWLVCYLLTECERRLEEERSKGSEDFDAFGNCQAYYLRTLTLAFAEHSVLQHFYFYTRSRHLPADIRRVLNNLGCLYGLWSLEKHLSLLYQGGFIVGAQPARLVRQAVVHLCDVLKDDAVSLVDVFAPPDGILNSALGGADGQVCKNIFQSLMNRPGALEVPSWWNEVRDFKSKL